MLVSPGYCGEAQQFHIDIYTLSGVSGAIAGAIAIATTLLCATGGADNLYASIAKYVSFLTKYWN
jgi:hypothetical protein